MLGITQSIEWLEKEKPKTWNHSSSSPSTSFGDLLLAKKRRPMTDFIKKHKRLSHIENKTSMEQKKQFIKRTREIELMLVEQRLPSVNNELERLRLIGELRYFQSMK